MKTLLILASHTELAEAIRSALPADQYRVIHRLTIEDAEPFTASGMIDLCVLDAELTGVQAVWTIEKVRRRLPHAPLVVCTGARAPEWEEEAFLQGVAQVLTKPVRPRLLNAILERLSAPAPVAAAGPRPPVTPPPRAGEEPRFPRPAHSAAEALGVLSNFSGILTHSLNAEALLREFLLQLRAILGVNRAAIFLRQPVTGLARATAGDARSMRSACALGLSSGLLEHFELSFESGIGGHLHRQGRILRNDSFETQNDPGMRKEFELLGAQVAIPILDRETLVGVAVFDGRVTGEPLANGELELVFHLLEELGLAVKNIWLHSQLAANHEMMADVLRELSSACVVVSRELVILHANKAARQMFARGKRGGGELEFSDLPQALGSKVYQVLQTGSGIATFKHQPAETPGASHSVTIIPLTRAGASAPASALLMVEDHTQSEQLRKLEIEAANLRLVKGMADRIAHEVGNAMVPLSTHQQLLGEKFRDAEFRSSLDLALSETVKRVNRLINQMRYLARDAVISRESLPLGQLLEEAFKEAHKHQPAKTAKLQFENGGQPVVLAGDRAALRHALSEVLLNAIQANPADARIQIKATTDNDGQGQEWVHIDVADNGAGFTPEAAQKVPTPFFTTRTVGLGLGLCVARKVLETHQGRLSILTQAHGQSNSVRISLPVTAAPAAN